MAGNKTLLLLLSVLCLSCTKSYAKDNQPPNIVVLLADDLGIGDVGCFGNDTIRTPHIDSICRRGVKLSQHLTADAMCTPSRSAFLTSRMPVRTGMAASSLVGVLPFISSSGGLPANETTFAKLLQGAGYKTALIGKWHLGLSCATYDDHCHHPNNHGFDYFFGIPLTNFRNVGNDSNLVLDIRPELIRNIAITGAVIFASSVFFFFYIGFGTGLCTFVLFVIYAALAFLIVGHMELWNSIVLRNGEIIEQPMNLENMSPRLVNEGIQFLEQQSTNKPFLLYMSWIQVHTALHATQKFQGHSVHGPYGDEVEELDWSIGEILSALDKFKLMDNTIIYFSSDNGGHIEEHHGHHGYRTGGHNGQYRGSKAQGGQEGGIRVPSAIMWPGKIPQGKELTVATSQMDMFPTFLGAAGVSIPTDRLLDGLDLRPHLLQPSAGNPLPPPPHKFLYHYCGVWLHAVRYTPGNGDDVYKVYFYLPDWKRGDGCYKFMCSCAHHHTKLDVPKITNIARDIRETSPLDQSADKYKLILEVVQEAVKEHERTLTVVPQQLGEQRWPRLRLQPCCGLPNCLCSNDKQNALNYIPPWNRK